MKKPSDGKIAFIGAGKIAEAIISAITSSGICAGDIVVSDISVSRRKYMRARYGVGSADDNRSAVKGASLVFLCVKPQHLAAATEDIAAAAVRMTVVSVAAGIDLRFLEKKLPLSRVIRTMPNTPVAVSEGIVCFALGRSATARDAGKLRRILGKCAALVEMPERMLDRATAVSGSGPAYFYYFTEALSAAARRMGFDARTADLLAVRTAAGAGKMMKISARNPSELRADVTSAGGTTAEAVKVFERRGLKEMVAAAASAALKRAAELSKIKTRR